MYAMNLCKRPVLITPDEVKAMAPVDHSFDPKKLVSAIIIAEERFIRPMLGDDFYDALRASKNTIVTDINKASLQTLLNSDFDRSQAPHYTLLNGDIVNASELMSTDNQTLWNDYLQLLVAECVIFTAIPTNFAHNTNEGIMKNNPATAFISESGAGKAASIELAEAKFLMDKMLNDRISPLRDALGSYLCRKKSLYPLYIGCKDCDKDVTMDRKTGWILDVYDDDPGRCCD